MNSAMVALLALSSTWSLVTSLSVSAVTLRKPARAGEIPSVSVLKPLCGADPSLFENLRSFFEQDHPSFQLVFGAQNPKDPALEVVNSLRQLYPQVDVAVVVHDFAEGLNPKVRNLRGMLGHAKHELLLISDSNVKAGPGYLLEACAEKVADPRVGLVTNLFVGVGGNTLGAAIERVQLAGFVAGGAATPSLLGHAAVIGKSMLIHRRELEAIGGLEAVKDVLAEDYVIGQRLEAAGFRVAIAPTVLSNVVGELSLRALVERHARWAMMRRRLCPAAFYLEPLTNPLLLLPLAFAALGNLAFVWLLTTWFIRDVLSTIALSKRSASQTQGDSSVWALIVSPLRDLAMMVAWSSALFARHVSWRGTRLRVGRSTSLSPVRSNGGATHARLQV